MALFVIERNFAEQLDADALDYAGIRLVQRRRRSPLVVFVFCPPTISRPTASMRPPTRRQSSRQQHAWEFPRMSSSPSTTRP